MNTSSGGKKKAFQPLPRRQEALIRGTQRVRFYAAIAVSLLTFLVYIKSLQNGFVNWDDDEYIYNNFHIRSFNLTFLRWAFTTFYASNWHPLTWISAALDYAVWGLNPLGHHLTNNILHSVNTFIVVLLAARLLGAQQEKKTGSVPAASLDTRAALTAAAVTGVLFGLHPLHVESVAWVSERKDLLCALFFMLSIMMYLTYVEEEGRGPLLNPKGALSFNKRYLLTVVFFIFALMSKPMAVSLPFVLLILDWYPYGRINSVKTLRNALIEKLPFILLTICLSILTVMAQKTQGAIKSIELIPFPVRLLVAAKALLMYLLKMLAPVNLIPFYQYPRGGSLISIEYMLPIVLIIGVTIVCAGLANRYRVLPAVWCYYVVTLLPVLGIVQVGEQAMADRYTYLPSVGPFLLVGLGAAMVQTRMKSGMICRSLAATIAITVVILLSYSTIRQIRVWRNSFDLWNYVIEKNPSIPVAYNNRGLIWSDNGRADEALKDFDAAIALNPSYALAHFNRALIYLGRNDKEFALLDLQMACRCGSQEGCLFLQFYRK
jgi:hypothetical protein